MKMSLVIEGLRSDIEAVGELGDEAVAELADRIGAVFTRSAPSRILELLSAVAAEISDELPDGHVEIRVVGDDVELVYVPAQGSAPEGDADLSARISLRLPDHLKSRVELAATREGISVNGYIVRMLERGVSSTPGRTTRGAKRLQGFGTS
jgi:hypothetical protein